MNLALKETWTFHGQFEKHDFMSRYSICFIVIFG